MSLRQASQAASTMIAMKSFSVSLRTLLRAKDFYDARKRWRDGAA
jgi:hypothetical protein